jgi:hypothetical protein
MSARSELCRFRMPQNGFGLTAGQLAAARAVIPASGVGEDFAGQLGFPPSR